MASEEVGVEIRTSSFPETSTVLCSPHPNAHSNPFEISGSFQLDEDRDAELGGTSPVPDDWAANNDQPWSWRRSHLFENAYSSGDEVLGLEEGEHASTDSRLDEAPAAGATPPHLNYNAGSSLEAPALEGKPNNFLDSQLKDNPPSLGIKKSSAGRTAIDLDTEYHRRGFARKLPKLDPIDGADHQGSQISVPTLYKPDLKGYELGLQPSSHKSRLKPTITEREIGNTYYSVKFSQVQSGTFFGRPAWLLVLDAAFHTSNSRNYRFKAVEITIDFGGQKNGVYPGEVASFSPKMMYGAAKMEGSKWHWEVSGAPNIAVPPATVELGRVKIGRDTEYSIAHMLKLEGTSRGIPSSKKVVWSVEERKMDGIPTYLPPLALIVTHQPGQTLFAKVTVRADTGFSMNPRRWPLFSGDNARQIPLDPNGPRQGATLLNSILDTFNLAQYIQQYLADEEIKPARDAFVAKA